MTAPPKSETFLDAILAALHRAASYNRADQERPAAILWTDREQQWGPLLSRLRQLLPLLTLGEYDPATRSGPAYWLRCMIARALPEDSPPADAIPIVYLPGISRQDLRAVEECPRELQPLAELQYRSVFWTHRNGRDWTPTGFLQSEEGGLDVEIGADAGTREAVQRTLPRLADEPLERLRREAPLRTAFFDALLHPDEARELLLWLNAPDAYRQQADIPTWASFRVLSRSRYGFDPETDGEITAARLLGERQGSWETVWNRFVESPSLYPAVPSMLGRARPHQQMHLWDRPDSWPQDNQDAENRLRQALLDLGKEMPSLARESVETLEGEHGPRREWVWARLGRSPLAAALRHLGFLAGHAERSLVGTSVTEIAIAYAEWGWQVDAAALDALASVESSADAEAVKSALSALYRPWLDEAARTMQAVIQGNAGTYAASGPCNGDPGTCILFVDGLRLDQGKCLSGALESAGLDVSTGWRLAALPTMTGTAKPAASPVAGRLTGGSGLEAAVRASGTRVTIEVLRRLLEEEGYQVLRGNDLGDTAGRGWTEVGSIDANGHDMGWKMARQLPFELRTIQDRARALLEHGWRQLTIITDHGWLLVPGDLPKVSLPENATEIRKGRCARLKPLANTDQQTVPWFWDPEVSIAIAPGISCYEAGREYEHGGVSPQECVVPVITVRPAGPTVGVDVVIRDIDWKGLRCVIVLGGASTDMAIDLRSRPRDPASSLAVSTRVPDIEGRASLLVADDSREGEAAMVLVLGPDEAILAQAPTVVGG